MALKHGSFKELLSTMFKSHPWHSVSPGPDVPSVVTSYIEIVPPGAVKFELDKATGHLHIDRPQAFSSACPTLYGFIPQTYCGDGIGKLAAKSSGRKVVGGDGDPLDICILSEREFNHGDILVKARVIGGLLMIDKGEADDKIIAVLDQDLTFGHIKDLSEVPPKIIDRLKHYFLSYKRPPASAEEEKGKDPVVVIDQVYGAKHAQEVIRQSMTDYVASYGTEDDRLEALRSLLAQGISGSSQPDASKAKTPRGESSKSDTAKGDATKAKGPKKPHAKTKNKNKKKPHK